MAWSGWCAQRWRGCHRGAARGHTILPHVGAGGACGAAKQGGGERASHCSVPYFPYKHSIFWFLACRESHLNMHGGARLCLEVRGIVFFTAAPKSRHVEIQKIGAWFAVSSDL